VSGPAEYRTIRPVFDIPPLHPNRHRGAATLHNYACADKANHNAGMTKRLRLILKPVSARSLVDAGTARACLVMVFHEARGSHPSWSPETDRMLTSAQEADPGCPKRLLPIYLRHAPVRNHAVPRKPASIEHTNGLTRNTSVAKIGRRSSVALTFKRDA
jgi:hypothetical protein